MLTARRLGFFALILASLTLSGCDLYIPVFHEDPTALREDRNEEAKQTDERIRGDILAGFVDQDAGTLKNVTVDVYEGRVLLIGTVAGAEARITAGAVAGSVEDVVAVINETQIMKDSSLRDKAEDLSIENQLKKNMRKSSAVNSFNLRWHSVNGVVYIFGRAMDVEERDSALNIVKGVKGITKVVDHIIIRPPEGGQSWLQNLL